MFDHSNASPRCEQAIYKAFDAVPFGNCALNFSAIAAVAYGFSA
jgi:hypothetical protein